VTVRPLSRRRLFATEELVELVAAVTGAEFEVEELERRLRRFGSARVQWRGSGWCLSDPAWRLLLGDEFEEVLRVGVDAYESPLPRRRPRPRCGWSLLSVAHFHGEDIELVER